MGHDETTEEREQGWVVIAQEPDQISAEIVLHYLHGFAIPTRLAPGDNSSFLGLSPFPTRVLVPAGWAEEAVAALRRRYEEDDSPRSPL